MHNSRANTCALFTKKTLVFSPFAESTKAFLFHFPRGSSNFSVRIEIFLPEYAERSVENLVEYSVGRSVGRCIGSYAEHSVPELPCPVILFRSAECAERRSRIDFRHRTIRCSAVFPNLFAPLPLFTYTYAPIPASRFRLCFRFRSRFLFSLSFPFPLRFSFSVLIRSDRSNKRQGNPPALYGMPHKRGFVLSKCAVGSNDYIFSMISLTIHSSSSHLRSISSANFN